MTPLCRLVARSVSSILDNTIRSTSVRRSSRRRSLSLVRSRRRVYSTRSSSCVPPSSFFFLPRNSCVPHFIPLPLRSRRSFLFLEWRSFARVLSHDFLPRSTSSLHLSPRHTNVFSTSAGFFLLLSTGRIIESVRLPHSIVSTRFVVARHERTLSFRNLRTD